MRSTLGGLFIQGWRQLFRAHKDKRLATDGLYGVVRHPQYTGLFIGLFGEEGQTASSR